MTLTLSQQAVSLWFEVFKTSLSLTLFLFLKLLKIIKIPQEIRAFRCRSRLFQALASFSHTYFNFLHPLLLSQTKKLSQALIPELFVKHSDWISLLISCSHTYTVFSSVNFGHTGSRQSQGRQQVTQHSQNRGKTFSFIFLNHATSWYLFQRKY